PHTGSRRADPPTLSAYLSHLALRDQCSDGQRSSSHSWNARCRERKVECLRWRRSTIPRARGRTNRALPSLARRASFDSAQDRLSRVLPMADSIERALEPALAYRFYIGQILVRKTNGGGFVISHRDDQGRGDLKLFQGAEDA